MTKKERYKVVNISGVEVELIQTITKNKNGTFGDDAVTLHISPDTYIHMTGAQSKRFARQLLRMAQNLMTAEERQDVSDTPIITIPGNLLNMLKHGKEN